jgi:hypothetical protein
MIPVLVVVAIAAFLLYETYGTGGGTEANSECFCGCAGGCQLNCCGGITSDPSTWPSGDRIFLVCHAIAYAEGANVAGSNPDRLNNPGDISDYYNTYGGEVHSGSNVTEFPNKATGWNILHRKIQNIANGASSSYSATDSWNVIAQKWAGDWQNWVNIVSQNLGVDPNSTLADYLNS